MSSRDRISYPRPSEATTDAPLAPSTTVTVESASRAREDFRLRIRRDQNLLHLIENLAEICAEHEKTFDQRWVSGRTVQLRAQGEEMIRFYTEAFADKVVPGVDPASIIRLDNPLSVASNRLYWKGLVSFLSLRSGRYINRTVGMPKSRFTLHNAFVQCVSAYKRLTRISIDKEVVQEAVSVMEKCALNHVKDKPIATFDDFKIIVFDGVFGDGRVFRNARERTQCAAILSTQLFTASRPSELIRGVDQSDYLRWKDVDFYVILWDENEPRDKDGNVDSNARLRLCCDVKLRNLKGMRNDPAGW